jgi:protein TonB
MKAKLSLVLMMLPLLALPALAQGGETTRPLQLRVSSGVAEGLRSHYVAPAYPAEARRNHIQGDVVVRLKIDTEGNPTDVTAVRGAPTLADAAVAAIRHWKYRPYLLNGKPVMVETTALVKFHL